MLVNRTPLASTLPQLKHTKQQGADPTAQPGPAASSLNSTSWLDWCKVQDINGVIKGRKVITTGGSGDAPNGSRDEPGGADVVSMEQGLVKRAQAGDRQALKSLLQRHSDALYGRVILPRTGDPTVAEDILKATMVTAIEKLDTFRWQGRSIYHWLRRIAVNKVVDHHRRRQRSARLSKSLAQEPALDVLPTRTPGPEEALIAEQERELNKERIQQALTGINPRYQRAIRLRLMEELPRDECARRMEVAVGTFDVLLFRALKAMRKQFGERCDP